MRSVSRSLAAHAPRVVAALAAAALCAAPATAQMAGSDTGGKGSFGLAVLGGYFSMSSDDFEDEFEASIKSGVGGEVSFRYGIARQLVLAAAATYSSHEIEDSDFDIALRRVALEPRYLFRTSSPVLTPFIGGRLQYARYTIADVPDGSGGETGDVTGSGFGFGAVGGLSYAASRQVSIEGALVFASTSFGNAKFDGDVFPDSDGSATNLSLQVGVVFKLGGR